MNRDTQSPTKDVSCVFISIWEFFSFIREYVTANSRSSPGGVLYEKVFLEISQNLQENTCSRVSFLIKLQVWGSKQMFSCEFCEISKNNFFTEHLRKTASVFSFVRQYVTANSNRLISYLTVRKNRSIKFTLGINV